MRSGTVLVLLLIGAAATLPETAHAYFGPGAGVTMLGALWGVVLAIAFAVFSFLAWPIRALLRRRRRASIGAGAAAAATVPGVAAARDGHA
jgi:hypothetical protein